MQGTACQQTRKLLERQRKRQQRLTLASALLRVPGPAPRNHCPIPSRSTLTGPLPPTSCSLTALTLPCRRHSFKQIARPYLCRQVRWCMSSALRNCCTGRILSVSCHADALDPISCMTVRLHRCAGRRPLCVWQPAAPTPPPSTPRRSRPRETKPLGSLRGSCRAPRSGRCGQGSPAKFVGGCWCAGDSCGRHCWLACSPDSRHPEGLRSLLLQIESLQTLDHLKGWSPPVVQAPRRLAHYGVKERLQGRWAQVVQGAAAASPPVGEVPAPVYSFRLLVFPRLGS